MKTDLFFLFTGLFGFALGFTIGRSFPWKPLVLLLCMSISAVAALPPLPVPRPVPLQSPKAASQPKSTPMLRTIAPASVPLTEPTGAMTVTVTTNINFMGCNPLDPRCIMYFNQNVAENQPAGAELTIYMKDVVNAPEGHKVAWFGAATFDRKSEFTWYQPMDQFPKARFFFTMKVYPIVPASRSTAAPVVWWDTQLKYASAKSVKK